MGFFRRIFGDKDERAALRPLYEAIVAKARDRFWYETGEVPDTLDGRFDMMAAVTALVLLRLEALGAAARRPSVLLTEIFIDDMDASLRQIGIGDYVVGKHIGRMMSALGGRLAAFREARAQGSLAPAVQRNIFHEADGKAAAVAGVAARLEAFAAALDAAALDSLLAGELP